MTDARARSELRLVSEEVEDFRALFDREVSYVWHTLRRLGIRGDELKDAVQEVFITAHRIMADYDRSRPLRPWLFGIAYRIAARFRTSQPRNFPFNVDALEAVDPSPAPDEAIALRERRDLVLRAIDAIDFNRRAVFILSEIDEVSMPEIANVLAIPLNTAYSRMRVAREEFAAAVKRLGRTGGEHEF